MIKICVKKCPDSNALRNLNLCSYTNFRNNPDHPLSKNVWDGTCDSKCWKGFFDVHYERKTPCNGDRGTSLMVEEGVRVEEGGIVKIRNVYDCQMIMRICVGFQICCGRGV